MGVNRQISELISLSASFIRGLTQKPYLGVVDPNEGTALNRNKRITLDELSQHYGKVTAISGSTWDGTNQYLLLNANKSITLSPGTNRTGILFVKQDATGSRTLTINGQSYAINSAANSRSLVSYLYNDALDEMSITFAASVYVSAGPFADGSGSVDGGGTDPGGATALNAPTGLVCDVISSTEIDLNWTDTNTSPNETSVKVYRNTSNNFGTATLHATLAADSVLTAVTGLTASTLYYFWIVAGGNGTTTSDSSPSTVVSATTSAGVVADYIAFTPGGGSNGITESPTGTWTDAGSGDGWGLATSVSLASSANGWIQQKWTGSINNGAVLGFGTANSLGDFSTMAYGVYAIAGTWWKVVAGTNTDTGVAVVTNQFIRIARSGANTLKIETSMDEVTWTTIHTFAATSTAQLYPKIDIVVVSNKASEVKGVGLT